MGVRIRFRTRVWIRDQIRVTVRTGSPDLTETVTSVLMVTRRLPITLALAQVNYLMEAGQALSGHSTVQSAMTGDLPWLGSGSGLPLLDPYPY